MKTNIKHVVIRPEQKLDEQTERLHSVELSIRTEEGILMTNRLQRLLRNYGERLVVPNRLVLEILNDRNRKSREVKANERDLEAYADAFGETLGLMVELCSSAGNLLDQLIENCSDDALLQKLTADIERVNNAIDAAEEFFDCVLEECDDDCDCECAEDE